MPRHPLVWLGCRIAARHEDEPDTRPLDVRRPERLGPSGVTLGEDGVLVDDLRVPVSGGEIMLRRYRLPHHAPGPAHLLAHGGSFWSGSLDQVDALAREYVLHAGCAVFSVGYRLAPEHVFPTAAEDYYAALCWVSGHAGDLGVDAGRISVGGVSVGGNLAAVTALMARDRCGPPICFQLLEVPVLDLTMSRPSMARFAGGHLLTRAELDEGYRFYVGDDERRRDPYASPLLAPSLAGLPPAFVLTAEFDPLRDEGEAYAHRLNAEGVWAQLVRARGHVHSSLYAPRWLRSAGRYRRRCADALRTAYRARP